MSKNTEPYLVEIDSPGCEMCSDGKTWTVFGPGETAISQSFFIKEDAVNVADMLNDAYRQGRSIAADSCACQHDGRGELVTECEEHRDIREDRDMLKEELTALLNTTITPKPTRTRNSG